MRRRRTSAARRHMRAELAVRDSLVRTRARYIARAKACLRREGLRVAPGASGRFLERLAAVTLPAALAGELAPLVARLAPLNRAIAAADHRTATLVAQAPVMRRPTTVPGVGPVIADAFVATPDTATRFRSAAKVMAYARLVPSEGSSAERRLRGASTTSANRRMTHLATGRAARAARPHGVAARVGRVASTKSAPSLPLLRRSFTPTQRGDA